MVIVGAEILSQESSKCKSEVAKNRQAETVVTYDFYRKINAGNLELTLAKLENFRSYNNETIMKARKWAQNLNPT